MRAAAAAEMMARLKIVPPFVLTDSLAGGSVKTNGGSGSVKQMGGRFSAQSTDSARHNQQVRIRAFHQNQELDNIDLMKLPLSC